MAAGTVRPRQPVKYIVAATFRTKKILQQAVAEITSEAQKIDLNSVLFDFNHTNYYSKEMGEKLKKQFFSFEELHSFEYLVKLKHRFLEIEKQFAEEDKRKINLDPAYMEQGKLVVASTKNFSHRIYIGEGIFGDVQLVFRGGEFHANPWTYADYISQPVMDFFLKVRDTYSKQLKAYGTNHV